MVRYLRTGLAVAAFLVTPIDAPAVDLSLTSIYQGRPSAAAAGWVLADRWTIHSRIETPAAAPAPGQVGQMGQVVQVTANSRTAWSTGEGYTRLTRWGLKGEYDYVNFLDPGVSDPPAGSTTIVKTAAPPNRRAVKIGGNYGL